MAAQSSLLSVVVFRGLPVCRQCYGGALGSLGRPSPRGLGRAPRPRKASGLAVQEASGTKHPAASWLRMASWRRCMQTSTTHPHDDDSRKEAVELINKLTTGYWENTFITADRASEEYLLRPEDLGELTTRAVRSAHETTSSSNVVLYLKTDVERRAIEVWGSWPALEAELWRRQTAREEEEKRRQGGCRSTVVVLRL
jgi:hypothetical protein